MARRAISHRGLAGDDRQAGDPGLLGELLAAAAARRGAGCRGRPAAPSCARRSLQAAAPSLPAVVVLPEPCRPTIRIGDRRQAAFRLSGTAPSPPSASTRASLTILTTCWPGVTERSTSAPMARSRTLAMKSRTTGSATSASSSARRTSRSASSTSASVSAPRRGAGRRRRRVCRSGLRTWGAFEHGCVTPKRETRRCANTRGAAEPPRWAGTGWWGTRMRRVMGGEGGAVKRGEWSRSRGTPWRFRRRSTPRPAPHGLPVRRYPCVTVDHVAIMQWSSAGERPRLFDGECGCEILESNAVPPALADRA